MTPAYFRDMQVIDERLTSLEKKVDNLLNILLKLETLLLKEEN